MARPRRGAAALNRLFQAAAEPVFAVDSDRRIVYCNGALADWIGHDADDILGVRCDYFAPTEDGLAAAAALVCPPPECFAGRSLLATASRRLASGDVETRAARFHPLTDEAGAVGVLAIVAAEEAPAAEQGAEPTPAQLHRRLIELRGRRRAESCDPLTGQSPEIRLARRRVEVAAATDAPIVVVGPSGAGARRIAQAIHDGRTEAALLPLPCRPIDAESLQAAVREFKRSDAESDAAMLLLDVDDLPQGAQDELAGFFSLPGFELRTLATAGQDLIAMADRGEFRRDLALRLSALSIEIPPLAARTEDVPLLAQQALEARNARGGGQLAGFTPEALDRLAAYHWPGEAAELVELVQEACDRAAGPLVAPSDLPKRLSLAADAAQRPRRQGESIVLDDFLAEIEAELIRRALLAAGGNKSEAARLLGVTRARLHRRLSQLEGDVAKPATGQAEEIDFEPAED